MENPEGQLSETPNGHQHTQNQKGKTTWAQKAALLTNGKDTSIDPDYKMVDYFKSKKNTFLFQTQ